MARKSLSIIENAKNNGLEWVMVRKNDTKTLNKLRADFSFHDLDLDDVAPPIQSVKLVIRSEYLFLILQYPLLDTQTGVVKSAEIDFFIEPNRIVTIDTNSLPQVQEIFESFKSTKNGIDGSEMMVETLPRLLHMIIDNLLMSIYPMMRQATQDIENIESMLFEEFDQKIIREILRIKMNIVNTRKAIQAQEEILKKFISALEFRFKYPKRMNAYFQQLVDDTKDIWNLTELQKDTINALHETNSSLADFRINDIMKTLTIFSVIVFPLTLLAAIFGMNAVNMPFVNHPFGFWMILGIMLLGSFGMLIFFKKKRWI
ncbi:magnesium transporter CorA family protein [Patescibacteria group bacterium]|nr:magnesium transporter CorA family protein [Patescibacteria group bacterium]